MRTPKNIKEIEKRVKNNEPVTFAERNVLKIFIEKHRNKNKQKAAKVMVHAIIVFYFLAFLFGCNAKPDNETIYLITSHTFSGNEQFISDSIISKDDNCITFRYAFGEKTVCGNYSFSKY